MTSLTTHNAPLPCPSGNKYDVTYKHWVTSIGVRLSMDYSDVPLFTTNTGPQLWDAYINNFPLGERDYHQCSCCRQFIEKYGSLVTIGSSGSLVPVMWDIERAPSRYRASVSIMADILKGQGAWGDYAYVNVTGVFVSSSKLWGTPPSDMWRHYSVQPPPKHVCDGSGPITPNQVAALYNENYRLLQRYIDKYYREPEFDVIARGLSLVKNDDNRFHDWREGRTKTLRELLGWFHNLTYKLNNQPMHRQDNIIWLAAATAPLSYCHIGNSVVGRFLDLLLATHYTEYDTSSVVHDT